MGELSFSVGRNFEFSHPGHSLWRPMTFIKWLHDQVHNTGSSKMTPRRHGGYFERHAAAATANVEVNGGALRVDITECPSAAICDAVADAP